jgi:hypothetical protein
MAIFGELIEDALGGLFFYQNSISTGTKEYIRGSWFL